MYDDSDGSKDPSAAAQADEAAAKLCVERDFLHLSAPKRGDPPGDGSLLPAAPQDDGDLRGAAAASPPRRTYNATTGRTMSINSDDMSYSYLVFSHNPSCSLTHNSIDIYAAWEGTNGSVHSRFNLGCPFAAIRGAGYYANGFESCSNICN